MYTILVDDNHTKAEPIIRKVRALETGLAKYSRISSVNHLCIGCNYHRWLTKESMVNKNLIEPKDIGLDNSDSIV